MLTPKKRGLSHAKNAHTKKRGLSHVKNAHTKLETCPSKPRKTCGSYIRYSSVVLCQESEQRDATNLGKTQCPCSSRPSKNITPSKSIQGNCKSHFFNISDKRLIVSISITSILLNNNYCSTLTIHICFI